jgi:hypothetical protein
MMEEDAIGKPLFFGLAVLNRNLLPKYFLEKRRRYTPEYLQSSFLSFEDILTSMNVLACFCLSSAHYYLWINIILLFVANELANRPFFTDVFFIAGFPLRPYRRSGYVIIASIRRRLHLSIRNTSSLVTLHLPPPSPSTNPAPQFLPFSQALPCSPAHTRMHKPPIHQPCRLPDTNAKSLADRHGIFGGWVLGGVSVWQKGRCCRVSRAHSLRSFIVK